MELQFEASSHKYQSIDNPDKKWISVTKLTGLFKPTFDPMAQSIKSSKNKKSKWYGIDPERIRAIWKNEGNRAVTLGSWYHDQREAELLACQTVRREGIDLEVVQPIEQDGKKFSPDQNLVPGIYPEHLAYLKSASLCGQADRVEVIGDKVNIYDYKTSKEIKTEGYTNWEGKTSKLLNPLGHLDDCNLNHYALQLSVYMYMILKHNHHLKPGKMEIHHIVFEIEDTDDYGYPIVAYDAAGDPQVKEVIPYEVPYLKSEVQNMIKYIKLKPNLI